MDTSRYISFNYNSISPELKSDNAILNDASLNVTMFNSRKEALESLVADINQMTSKGLLEELHAVEPLQWKDATVSTYAQSIIARVIGPVLIVLLVPLFRYRIKQFIDQSYDKNPEWWV